MAEHEEDLLLGGAMDVWRVADEADEPRKRLWVGEGGGDHEFKPGLDDMGLFRMVFHEYADAYVRLYAQWFNRLWVLLPMASTLLEGWDTLAPIGDEWRQMALDQWRIADFAVRGKTTWQGAPPYRDHVLHPVAVSLLGQEILDRADTRMRTRVGEVVAGHLRRVQRREPKAEDVWKGVVWAWHTAALFHDVGYRAAWRMTSACEIATSFRGFTEALHKGTWESMASCLTNVCNEEGEQTVRECDATDTCTRHCLPDFLAERTRGAERTHGVPGSHELARSIDANCDVLHQIALMLACRASALHDAKDETGALISVDIRRWPLAFWLRLLDIVHECGRVAHYHDFDECPENESTEHRIHVCERAPRMSVSVSSLQEEGRVRLRVRYQLRSNELTRTGYCSKKFLDKKLEDLASLVDGAGNTLKAAHIPNVKPKDLGQNGAGEDAEFVGVTVDFVP